MEGWPGVATTGQAGRHDDDLWFSQLECQWKQRGSTLATLVFLQAEFPFCYTINSIEELNKSSENYHNNDSIAVALLAGLRAF